VAGLTNEAAVALATRPIGQQGAQRMITFVQKANILPETKAAGENRFDRIRKLAAEKHKKSDADTARNDRQDVEDKRPI
jgi:hypothetical protein